MNFRYRVKGKVSGAFILRGMHFTSKRMIDMYITENELDFVKSHCDIIEIVDLANSTSKAIPKNSVKQGVEKNELPKQNVRTNKVRISSKV